MLLKILSIIFLLALFRFVYRLVRTVLEVTGTRPGVRSGRQSSEEIKGERIVDVEFTEEKKPPNPDRNQAK